VIGGRRLLTGGNRNENTPCGTALRRLDLLKKISAVRTEEDALQKVKRAEALAEGGSDARVQYNMKIHSPPGPMKSTNHTKKMTNASIVWYRVTFSTKRLSCWTPKNGLDNDAW
jgi:hypothetical protein